MPLGVLPAQKHIRNLCLSTKSSSSPLHLVQTNQTMAINMAKTRTSSPTRSTGPKTLAIPIRARRDKGTTPAVASTGSPKRTHGPMPEAGSTSNPHPIPHGAVLLHQIAAILPAGGMVSPPPQPAMPRAIARRIGRSGRKKITPIPTRTAIAQGPKGVKIGNGDRPQGRLDTN